MTLGTNERACFSDMLETYRIILQMATEENKLPKMELMVSATMLKAFSGYCFLEGKIGEKEYTYIRDFNIVSGIPNHKAFYDILKRWTGKTEV